MGVFGPWPAHQRLFWGWPAAPSSTSQVSASQFGKDKNSWYPSGVFRISWLAFFTWTWIHLTCRIQRVKFLESNSSESSSHELNVVACSSTSMFICGRLKWAINFGRERVGHTLFPRSRSQNFIGQVTEWVWLSRSSDWMYFWFSDWSVISCGVRWAWSGDRVSVEASMNLMESIHINMWSIRLSLLLFSKD